MKIGILGSGMVGQALAAKLAAIGQDVMISARNPEKLNDFVAQHSSVRVGAPAETAAFGEFIFEALSGAAAVDALKPLAPALAGKILVDIANPLDFSRGMPPSLSISNTDSLGEQIQAALPETKVVKALNTLTAGLMVNPGALAGGDHTLFICGDDAAAKTEVMRFFTEWFGWRDMVDVGDITTARGAEAILLLWIRLFMKFGTPMFQFKLVR